MKTKTPILIERPIELNGAEYDCAMEIDVTVDSYEENHGPGLREPMSEVEAELTDLSAKLDGNEVEDKTTLRALRALAREWIDDNLELLAEKAG